MKRLLLGLLLTLLSVAPIQAQPFVVPPSPVTVANPAGTAAAGVTATAGGSLQVECTAGCGGGGPITADQGAPNTTANAWPIRVTDGTDSANVTAAGRLEVDGSGVVQPVSGTVAATQSGTWAVNATLQGVGTVFSGQQGVTAAAVALAANTAKSVCVKALVANTLNIFVGPTGITIATGMELAPGDAVCLAVTNSNLVFVIASGVGSSISFIGIN